MIAYPRLENREADGFRHVIDGAEFQPPGLILRAVHGRQEDDGDPRGARVRAQPLANAVAIQARHHDVEQNQVRLTAAAGQRQGALAAVGQFDGVLVHQHVAGQRQHLRAVIDDQQDRFMPGGFGRWHE